MMTYEDSYCLDTLLELIAEHLFFRVSKSLVGFSLHFSQLIFILIFTKPQRNRGMQYTLMYRNCIYMMDESTWENDDEFILHSRPLLATPLINLPTCLQLYEVVHCCQIIIMILLHWSGITYFTTYWNIMHIRRNHVKKVPCQKKNQ